jgi:UDP-4-amino-4,6-dideoxy-N-acetyl-beta-L-altrosamine transaminase
MNYAIPYGKHNINQKDIDAVVETLKSDFLTQGPQVEKFEKAFAKYVEADYAIAVSNGTSALHLCSLALGTNKHSRVITSPITFVASANCIEYCGGKIEFCDIDPETLCLDINKVKNKLENAPKGTYTGIIPVNFAGFPIDMEAFRKLADKHGLWLLEDSCHAPGGFFYDSSMKKQSCGNGKFADTAIFSFHPVKHIAAGEGGMITTNREDLYYKIKLLRTHGISKSTNLSNESPPGWYYEMQELGYNHRISDISCALGNSQLKRAKEGLEKRKAIAKKYLKDLSGLPLKIPSANFSEGHAFHLFVILTDKRDKLYSYLRECNIQTQIHYIPVYKHPYYKSKYGSQRFKVTEEYYSKCLSLPIYPTMTKDEYLFVVEKITNFF